jgi:hypothetical protein
LLTSFFFLSLVGTKLPNGKVKGLINVESDKDRTELLAKRKAEKALQRQEQLRQEMAETAAESKSSEETNEQKQKKAQTLLLLDAPNIAMRHGGNKLFSTAGIQVSRLFVFPPLFSISAFLPFLVSPSSFFPPFFFTACS